MVQWLECLSPTNALEPAGVTCGLSLFLVLVLALSVFSGSPVFLPPQ